MEFRNYRLIAEAAKTIERKLNPDCLPWDDRLKSSVMPSGVNPYSVDLCLGRSSRNLLDEVEEANDWQVLCECPVGAVPFVLGNPEAGFRCRPGLADELEGYADDLKAEGKEADIAAAGLLLAKRIRQWATAPQTPLPQPPAATARNRKSPIQTRMDTSQTGRSDPTEIGKHAEAITAARSKRRGAVEAVIKLFRRNPLGDRLGVKEGSRGLISKCPAWLKLAEEFGLPHGKKNHRTAHQDRFCDR